MTDIADLIKQARELRSKFKSGPQNARARNDFYDFARNNIDRLCDEFCELQAAYENRCKRSTEQAVEIAALRAENEQLRAVAEAARIVAYPRGYRDGNVPDDLHRALVALPPRKDQP